MRGRLIAIGGWKSFSRFLRLISVFGIGAGKIDRCCENRWHHRVDIMSQESRLHRRDRLYVLSQFVRLLRVGNGGGLGADCGLYSPRTGGR